MSESDDSDTWSGSFYDTESSSSSLCPTPRRLMDSITDKLQRINCVKRDVVGIDQEAMAEDSGKYLKPQRLASLLTDKLKQLDAKTDSEGNQPEATLKKVTFQELPAAAPSCSDTQPASDLKVEQIDLAKPSTSRAAAALPSSLDALEHYQNVANEKLDNENLAQMKLKKDKSIFLLNFPELTEFVQSVKVQFRKEDNERPAQQEDTDKELAQAETRNTAKKSAEDISENVMRNDGEIRVYETGRVTISIRENVFEMANGTGFEQEVVCVEMDEETQTGTMTSLGMAQHYIDVLPQMEEEDIDEIDDNRNGMDNAKKE